MIDGTALVRGLTIGSDTDFRWSDWPTGLLDTASIRVDDLTVPLRDGIVAGADFLGGRDVTFPVTIRALSVADGETKVAALNAAFAASPIDLPLDVRVSGTPAEYRLFGRPRGVDVAMSRAQIALGRPGGGVIHARCKFTATDPLRYSSAVEQITIGLADPGAGLVAPLVAPLSAGAGGVGLGSAVNAGGTAVRRWSATLHGPLSNPRLVHVDSGRFVQVQASVAAGQTVVLNGYDGSILLGGTTPRPSWRGPGSAWFDLTPGPNGLRLLAAAGSGFCVFEWLSGW